MSLLGAFKSAFGKRSANPLKGISNIGGATAGVSGVGGTPTGSGGFGGIAEEIAKRYPNAGMGQGSSPASQIGPAGQPLVGATNASNPNWVPETIMSDAAGNTSFNPTTGVSGKVGATGKQLPSWAQKAGVLEGAGMAAPGVVGKAPLDMGMAGLASQGLLRGSDPGVVQENIRQLKNQGLSDEDATNQALQFSQQ